MKGCRRAGRGILLRARDCREGSVSAIEGSHAGRMAPELSRSLGNKFLHVNLKCGVVQLGSREKVGRPPRFAAHDVTCSISPYQRW
jgi:hypothetical protein